MFRLSALTFVLFSLVLSPTATGQSNTSSAEPATSNATKPSAKSSTELAGENLKRLNQAVTAGEFKIAAAYMTQQGTTEIIGDLASIAISLADESINKSFPKEFDPFKKEFKQILDGAGLITQWEALNSDPVHFEKIQSLAKDAAGIKVLDQLLNAAAAMPWNGFNFRGDAVTIFDHDGKVFIGIGATNEKEFGESGQIPVYRFVQKDSMWKFDGVSEKQTARYNRKLAELPPTLTDPTFSGVTADGKKIAFADYKGKVVLFDFWGTWCGPCVAKLPKLEKIYTAFKKHGLEIVGVPMDDAETLTEFYKTKKISWDNVVDPQGTLKEKFGVKVYPTTMLLNKAGKHIHSNLEEDELVDELVKLFELNAADFESLKQSLREPTTDKTK